MTNTLSLLAKYFVITRVISVITQNFFVYETRFCNHPCDHAVINDQMNYPTCIILKNVYLTLY